MKPITIALALVFAVASAQAANIIGNFLDNSGNPSTAQLRIRAFSNNAAVGTNTLVGATTVVNLTNGVAQFTLLTGRYQVQAGVNPAVTIFVPDSDQLYQFNDLLENPSALNAFGQFRISAHDTRGGYLTDKLTAGTNTVITFSTNGTGVITATINSSGAGQTNGITDLSGDVTGTGPGSAATTIANGAVTETKLAANAVVTSKIALAAVVETNLANASVSAAALQENAVDNNAIAPLAVTPDKLNDTSRFDAGQFLGDPSTQDVKIQPGVTSASGASINWDWSDGQPTILRTTNTVDLTVTIINVPTLTDRSKHWKLELIADGTKTLTLAGAALQLRSGVFINPPPAGLNEYGFERSNGTNYYDVLTPGFSADMRIWGNDSGAAGLASELTINQILKWAFPAKTPTSGAWIYWDGNNFTNFNRGTPGEVLTSTTDGLDWGTAGSGFSFNVSGLSTNAIPINLYTNTIAENTTVRLHAVATGAGTTNSGTLTAIALVRRNTGGSATLVDTNNSINLPSSPEPNAYWTLSGNDALLQVVGITNNYYTWDAYGWSRPIFNGTNTYIPFTAGFNGSTTWWDSTVTPTGLTDGKAFTLVLWWDQGAGDASDDYLLYFGSGAAARLVLHRTTANFLNIIGYNAAASIILDATSSITINSATGWKHQFITCNLAGGDTNKFKWFVDGVQDTGVTINTFTDDSIDMSTTRYAVGAKYGGPFYATGSMADFVFNDTYFAAETPVGYFITSGGRPMSVGTDGSLPFGSAPVLYLSGGGGGVNFTNTASSYTMTIHGTPSAPSPP